MSDYRFTDYFEKEVLRKRPYLKKEWCIRVLEKPLRSELLSPKVLPWRANFMVVIPAIF